MDIVIEQIPEDPTPAQPQLQREVTGRHDTLEEAQLDAALHASAQEHAPLQAPEARPEEAPPPPPKRRGRPVGSKNKPKIIEQVPITEEPIVLNEPPPEEDPPPEARPKKPAPRKPRAPKAQPQAPPHTPQAPMPQTPLQVAASMLEILRLEQAERQYRKGQMYKSWVK